MVFLQHKHLYIFYPVFPEEYTASGPLKIFLLLFNVLFSAALLLFHDTPVVHLEFVVAVRVRMAQRNNLVSKGLRDLGVIEL